MAEILSRKIPRRTFLKATAATAAVAAVGDKLFGGPVSALVEGRTTSTQTTGQDQWFTTLCRGCRQHEPIRIRVVDGVAVKIDAIPGEPMMQGNVCGKSQAGLMMLYNPYRVKAPMKRTNPEKGLGVDPKWVEITWDEALDTVASKLKPVLENDPREFGIAHGFGSLNTSIISRAFGGYSSVKFAASICGGGEHIAWARTLSDDTMAIDYKYCDYLLIFGTNARGSAKGWVSTQRPFLEARARGMKVVVIDPAQADQARYADEWIPIRPATDHALVLAMLHSMVYETGLVDWEHMKLRTNGPYLIGPDGGYVRSKTETYEDEKRLGQTFGKPLVWDAVEGVAKTFDDETIQDFALEGTYVVDGLECQPAFQLFKDLLEPHTPEWAEPITTVPAATIRRIATEFGEKSRIGATMTFFDHPDGPCTLPLRPAAMGFGKGVQGHYHAVTISRALSMLYIITGAANVVGSTKGSGGLRTVIESGPDGVIYREGRNWAYKFEYPPQDPALSDIWPPRWGSGLEDIYTILEPEKHGIDFRIKVRLVNYTNEQRSKANPAMAVEALKAIPFHFGISYHFDEPTEMCDIVFPEPSWLERWEVINPSIGRYEYDNCVDSMNGYIGLRHPVVEPLYNTKDWGDAMMELADRMGMLAQWNAAVNRSLRLADAYLLEPDKKYQWKDVLDRQLKSDVGDEFGLEYFRVNGPKGSPAKGRADWYAYTKNPTARQPLYDEWIVWVAKQYREDRAKAGLPEIPVVAGRQIDVYSELIPLPVWRGRGPLDDAAPEYDLYAVNFQDVFGAMCMAMDNPWLHEFSTRFNPYTMSVWINRVTAEARGIRTGDLIKVTSQFGHTVEGEALVTEAIHPECIGIGGCYGSYSANANPVAREGTHFNALMSSDPAHWDPWSGNPELSPRVKVEKA